MNAIDGRALGQGKTAQRTKCRLHKRNNPALQFDLRHWLQGAAKFCSVAKKEFFNNIGASLPFGNRRVYRLHRSFALFLLSAECCQVIRAPSIRFSSL
jgi:hypothetical protein